MTVVGLGLAVGLLGGVGALLRFGLDGWIDDAVGGEFPWGTLAVNLSGSFLLGLLTGLHVDSRLLLLAGTGALGSYTTFSTWMLESHRLGENGELVMLLANLVVAGLAGLGAAALGWAVGVAL